jgi:hypothetical protein
MRDTEPSRAALLLITNKVFIGFSFLLNSNLVGGMLAFQFTGE